MATATDFMGSKNKLKLGLTGGIGSGKSTVASFFAAKGIDIINVDELSRNCVAKGQPALKAIEARYGAQILDNKGELKRRQLRTIIFESPSEKLWLEQLLHPRIRDLAIQQLGQSQSLYCILESPLLLETHQDRLVDRIIVVDVPTELQRQRAAERDQLSPKAIQAIMSTQLDRESRIARADYIICNENDLASTAKQVNKLHATLMRELSLPDSSC